MKRFYTWGWAVLWGLAISCQSGGVANKMPTDTRNSGHISISVDESFRPVMEEELKVFLSSNPGARITASYKSEAECLKDLQQDSTRMAFVTRGLNPDELAYFQSKLQFEPSFDILAFDAVGIIVNNSSPDTAFTIRELADILRGKGGSAKPYTAVFDGLNATSTIRFAMDSILKGRSFDPRHVFAAENSTGVLRYVAAHPEGIGFVGVGWIGNPEDTAQDAFRQKVRIAGVVREDWPGKPVIYPSQQDILTKSYPFTRGLYYIRKENYDGLGTGLVDFLKYERGQLIFRRAYLVPAILQFNVRDAKVNSGIR